MYLQLKMISMAYILCDPNLRPYAKPRQIKPNENYESTRLAMERARAELAIEKAQAKRARKAEKRLRDYLKSKQK